VARLPVTLTYLTLIYGLSKSSNCNDLGCIYFKVIYQLQSFSNGMIRSCKISTDKRVVWSLCNSRSTCNVIIIIIIILLKSGDEAHRHKHQTHSHTHTHKNTEKNTRKRSAYSIQYRQIKAGLSSYRDQVASCLTIILSQFIHR